MKRKELFKLSKSHSIYSKSSTKCKVQIMSVSAEIIGQFPIEFIFLQQIKTSAFMQISILKYNKNCKIPLITYNIITLNCLIIFPMNFIIVSFTKVNLTTIVTVVAIFCIDWPNLTESIICYTV